MVTIETSHDLSQAIDLVESMLNGKDSEKLLSEIRRYKANKKNYGRYTPLKSKY